MFIQIWTNKEEIRLERVCLPSARCKQISLPGMLDWQNIQGQTCLKMFQRILALVFFVFVLSWPRQQNLLFTRL